MSQPTDACPSCGERSLIAVCMVLAEYAVANEGEVDQDWSRREVDDDTAEPKHFRCGACGAEFPEFTLDDQGYLVRLGPSPTQAAPDGDAMTADGFGEWLAATVADWCRAEGLTPDGEGEDLGDLYRHLDDTDAWAATGVTIVPAYEDGVLYIVGPRASWLATTGIELGAECESLWFDPLSNLRLDVPQDELRLHGERLRRRADEVADLLSTGDAQTEGAATPHIAHWAFTNADNDLVMFSHTYGREPTEDDVRRDGYLSHLDDDGAELDEASFQEWHDALCQPGLVSVVPLR